MEIMVLDQKDNIEILRELGNEWKLLSNEFSFGLPIDVNIGLDTLRTLQFSLDGDVLVLINCEKIVGFIGLKYGLNHIGPGKISSECLFYVTPSCRRGGLKLKKAAKLLAKSKGCNFFIWNASKIAGNAERSGKLYERDGAVEFETSYLEVL